MKDRTLKQQQQQQQKLFKKLIKKWFVNETDLEYSGFNFRVLFLKTSSNFENKFIFYPTL